MNPPQLDIAFSVSHCSQTGPWPACVVEFMFACGFAIDVIIDGFLAGCVRGEKMTAGHDRHVFELRHIALRLVACDLVTAFAI